MRRWTRKSLTWTEHSKRLELDDDDDDDTDDVDVSEGSGFLETANDGSLRVCGHSSSRTIGLTIGGGGDVDGSGYK